MDDDRLPTEIVRRLKGSAWWDLLLTTRTLLAHTGLHDVGELLLCTVISNVRAILVLADIDISLKAAYSSFAGGNTVWIRNGLAFGGDKRMPLRAASDSEVLAALSCADLTAVKSGFQHDLNSDEMSAVCSLLGVAIYRLVATRDSGWQSAACRFR
jgi:hypothetical protein